MGALDGETVLITGGLQGLGHAIMARFVKERACVWVADLASPDDARVRAMQDRYGHRCRYRQLDVTDEPQWRDAAAAVEAEAGHLDALILNAGTTLTGPTEQIELADWRKLMAVNVDGVFLGIKSFVPLMRQTPATRRGGASIVVMSSIMGMVGYAEAAAYNTSKGAVRLLTKATAIEFCARQLPIRVNSLHPGFVATPLTVGGMEKFAAEGHAASADILLQELAMTTPMGRLGDADEIASAALFLASPESSYMTGSEIIVDGGWTAR